MQWLTSSFDNLKSKIQNPKWVGIFAIAFTFTFVGAVVEAQQPKKVPLVGVFVVPPPTAVSARIDAFRQQLHELGYIEGKNIMIESRSAEGKLERLPALAAELLRLKVDVIVSGGPATTRPAKEATKTIPIVMAQDDDPVANGFVASLARPGGNITGLSSYSAELNGKRVELLKDIVPKLSRLAVIGDSNYPGNAQSLKETELAAEALKVHIQYLNVLGPGDIETAFREASKERAHGALALQSAVLNSQRKHITDLAIKSRLPAMYYAPEFLDTGGLVSYAASITDLYRRAAIYVDKILKGAKPADLPVEQPKKFEFIINLKAAKQIGLTIPPNLLARADKVIK